LSNTTATKRVLSGMRPTGRLHIGHYFGALENWVKLQSNPDYDCFYFVADWHALTSDYADTSAVAQNSIEIAIDFLASGLDPAKSVIFLQSLVPEHAELHLLLSMVTPLGWLERIPTYKEQLENIQNKDLHTYGFLGYPTLQTADIVMYSDPGKSLFVPVGEDQVSHVEFSRELVRRFNLYYGGLTFDERLRKPEYQWLYSGLSTALKLGALVPEGRSAFPLNDIVWERVKSTIQNKAREIGLENLKELTEGVWKNHPFSAEDLVHYAQADQLIKTNSVLEEPAVLLTHTPRLPGLDGRKMSKSYGNAITLSESDDDIRKKTKVMVTDPARKRRTDPGNPDVCPVFDWHKLFSTPERDPGRLDWVRQGCTTAGIGCIECKSAMAENLIKWIAPVRERRLEYEQHPKRALDILDAGSAKARESAKETMARVRDAVFHWPSKRSELSR
jgi:tryptophanyl-tRNA synthetase